MALKINRFNGFAEDPEEKPLKRFPDSRVHIPHTKAWGMREKQTISAASGDTFRGYAFSEQLLAAFASETIGVGLTG